jgi:MFS family permease
LAMSPRSKLPVLALLGDRNFMAFWVASILNSISRFLELLVLSLYILDATDSTFQLGLIWVFSFIPRTVMSPFSGLIADRFNRQRILQIAQILNTIFASGILLLFAFNLIEPWHIFIAVFLQGGIRSLEDTTRRPALVDIVGSEHVITGISLAVIGLTLGRMIGPILGGILLSFTGFTEAYFCVLGVQLLAVGALSRVWIPSYRIGASREPVGRSLMEGVRYTLNSPVLMGLLFVSVVMNTMFFPVQQFIPAVGQDHLGVGPVLVGLLVAAEGFGRLASGGIMALTQGPKNRGLIFGVAVILVLVATMLFAWSPWYVLSFALLALTGVGVASFAIMQSSVSLLWTPQHMRGRVLGLRQIFLGIGNPIGALAIGILAAAFDIRWAILMSALTGILVLLPFLLLTPLIKRSSDTPPHLTN